MFVRIALLLLREARCLYSPWVYGSHDARAGVRYFYVAHPLFDAAHDLREGYSQVQTSCRRRAEQARFGMTVLHGFLRSIEPPCLRVTDRKEDGRLS